MSKAARRKLNHQIVENLLINKPVDIVLLKKQRNMLVDELDRWTDDDHGPEEKSLTIGLINFLDQILDIVEEGVENESKNES